MFTEGKMEKCLGIWFKFSIFIEQQANKGIYVYNYEGGISSTDYIMLIPGEYVCNQSMHAWLSWNTLHKPD